VLEVNTAGVGLLGYSREELLALPRLPFAANDFATNMLETPRVASGETTLLRRNGERIEVDIGIGPLNRPQDTRVLLYVRDVTEQRKMREQLVQAEKMTLMGRLAAGIAHEIRNPLSAVALNLQYLAHKAAHMPEFTEPLRDALEGTKRVEAVIENTLNLARITPPVLKPQHMNELVEQVLGFVKLSVQQKDVHFETALAAGLPMVAIDAKQIQQVLLNVLQNAIDASPEGGVVIASSRRHRTGEGETVEVAVRDHGAGMTPEQHTHLFEQFYTTKSGGTGLGLSISKQIMEKHKGQIHVEPADGLGTLVRLSFFIHS
jgi:PAS domain S-box-containing protein